MAIVLSEAERSTSRRLGLEHATLSDARRLRKADVRGPGGLHFVLPPTMIWPMNTHRFDRIPYSIAMASIAIAFALAPFAALAQQTQEAGDMTAPEDVAAPPASATKTAASATAVSHRRPALARARRVIRSA